ncbi:unnamed protein product [Cuscuta europaea]|uniref:Uncharacterized protein n=1 Tax=Cuscuta europaea TaxID=41803 RepID=A0A9P0ZQM3_CUSEU|nr:unnamed protein product [Cuscuta europaea]
MTDISISSQRSINIHNYFTISPFRQPKWNVRQRFSHTDNYKSILKSSFHIIDKSILKSSFHITDKSNARQLFSLHRQLQINFQHPKRDCPHKPPLVFFAHFVLTRARPEKLPRGSPIPRLLLCKHT